MTAARWVFSGALVLALDTTALAVAMNGDIPAGAAPLHSGFETPILALEFAMSVDDLAFLTGEVAADLRAFLVRVQFLDWFFPVAYAGMATLVFLGMALRGQLLALLGIGLAVATILADWQENATINGILDELENPICNAQTRPADPDAHVSVFECLPEGALDSAPESLLVLAFATDSLLAVRVGFLFTDTWIKWGLIAAYALLFAALLALDRKRWLALPSLAAALAIGATFAVVWSPLAGPVGEVMGILLLPFMLTFPVAAIMYLRAKPPAKRVTRTGEE